MILIELNHSNIFPCKCLFIYTVDIALMHSVVVGPIGYINSYWSKGNIIPRFVYTIHKIDSHSILLFKIFLKIINIIGRFSLFSACSFFFLGLIGKYNWMWLFGKCLNGMAIVPSAQCLKLKAYPLTLFTLFALRLHASCFNVACFDI